MNAYELMRADQLLDELQPDFPQEVDTLRNLIATSAEAEEHYEECECIGGCATCTKTHCEDADCYSEDNYNDVVVAVEWLIEELAHMLGLKALNLYDKEPQEVVQLLNGFRIKLKETLQ